MLGSAMPAATAGVDGLLVLSDSPVHRLPAQVKLVAAFAFVAVVVLTPAHAWPALLVAGTLVVFVLRLARLPARLVLKRVLVEAPFVLFALLMPFVAEGEQIAVLGVDVSRSGVIGGALVLAKSTIGVLTAIALAATTAPRELLVGLSRLRLPAVLIGILGFAIRYLSIAAEDLRRAEVARVVRGGRSGRLSALRSVAGTAGSAFVRTYERGERVHLAMLARGLEGPVPVLIGSRPTRCDWLQALALPLAVAFALTITLLW